MTTWQERFSEQFSPRFTRDVKAGEEYVLTSDVVDLVYTLQDVVNFIAEERKEVARDVMRRFGDGLKGIEQNDELLFITQFGAMLTQLEKDYALDSSEA